MLCIHTDLSTGGKSPQKTGVEKMNKRMNASPTLKGESENSDNEDLPVWSDDGDYDAEDTDPQLTKRQKQ